MTPRTVAVRYARALFDVARTEKLDPERLLRDLRGFTDLVKQHPSLSRVLANPAIPPARKRAVVEQLLAQDAVAPTVGRLLLLLADRDRLSLLDDLTEAFQARVREHQQIVQAEVTTAIPLPPERVSALRQGLARATGRQVQLEARVDPSIIGGAVTRIGSTVYDGSVTTQLEKLRQRLTESGI